MGSRRGVWGVFGKISRPSCRSWRPQPQASRPFTSAFASGAGFTAGAAAGFARFLGFSGAGRMLSKTCRTAITGWRQMRRGPAQRMTSRAVSRSAGL